MAYCEIAKKECPYLSEAQAVQATYTLARATPETKVFPRFITRGQYERRASRLEEKVAEIIATSQESCTEDSCGILGLAVQSSIILNAVEGIK